jgi:hypothetical protein
MWHLQTGSGVAITSDLAIASSTASVSTSHTIWLITSAPGSTRSVTMSRISSSTALCPLRMRGLPRLRGGRMAPGTFCYSGGGRPEIMTQ